MYQGIHCYRKNDTTDGIITSEIGGYTFRDIEFVVGFDVDRHKVGKTESHIFVEKENMEEGPIVLKGPVLDGVASLMNEYAEDFSETKFECDDLAARRLTDRTRIQTAWYCANELFKVRPSFKQCHLFFFMNVIYFLQHVNYV